MITNGFIVSGVIRHWDANNVSDDTVLIKKSN